MKEKNKKSSVYNKEDFMKKLSQRDVAQLIDISALKIDATYQDVQRLIADCKKYDIGAAFVWPCFSRMLGEAIKGSCTTFGTSLAFPSGQEPTFIKEKQAEYYVSLGAEEIDMVMNVGYLKSGWYKEALEDIKAVRKVCEGTSLKVIIEAMLLNDQQIEDACKIVLDSGADYVKSGTGFQTVPTTLHHVEIMKLTVGDRIKIKVAGGVRDLATLITMHAMGVSRFGIGMLASEKIIEEAGNYPDGVEVKKMISEDGKPLYGLY
jgi:deoxyribose-phosphate aldolase